MNRYAIIENGKVGNIVVADEALENNWIESPPAQVQIGWLYDGSDFTAPAPVQVPVRITKLQFRNRFTFLEKVAIETAAETDAAVRVLLKDQESAEYIDLTRGDTQQGVQLLVSKNLLTAERAAEILDPAAVND